MTPILNFLVHDTLPESKAEAKRVRRQAASYTMVNGELFRRTIQERVLCPSSEMSRSCTSRICLGRITQRDMRHALGYEVNGGPSTEGRILLADDNKRSPGLHQKMLRNANDSGPFSVRHRKSSIRPAHPGPLASGEWIF